MNINSYLSKVYSSPPCWEMVADIYFNELKSKLSLVNAEGLSTKQISELFRLSLHNNTQGFRQIDIPMDFSVVLMGKNTKLGLHHCGVFYKGKIVHALDTGNIYQDVSTLKDSYKLMEFWEKE